jgi:phosphopantothenoylcysteine decarboxylase / phosphopantothenate---cysteine ligase
MSLKNKRILITGGPTWVAIDPVRVISNTASGETGTRLSHALAKQGAKVTLLLGPGETPAVCKKVTVKRFQFFEELKKLLKDELLHQYDIIIHSAAVSDFKPAQVAHAKIDSHINSWQCKLIRTPKLVELIKKIAPNTYAVGFKFDPRITKNALLKSAQTIMQSARLDAVVANTIVNGKYQAYLVTQNSISETIPSKAELVKKLIALISL